MKRRHLIIAGLLLLARTQSASALICTRASDSGPVALPLQVVRSHVGPELLRTGSTAFIGKANHVADRMGSLEALQSRLEWQVSIQADYRAMRIISVGGWIIAQTEALAYAAESLRWGSEGGVRKPKTPS